MAGPLVEVDQIQFQNFIRNLSTRQEPLLKEAYVESPGNIVYMNRRREVLARRTVDESGIIKFYIDLKSKSGPEPPPDPEPGLEPTVSNLSPSTAAIGDPDLTLTVTGTNFTSSSIIVFNGGEEPTEFISDTELTTIVKPSTASVAGSYPVLVRQGSVDSSPRPFMFTEGA